MTSTRKVLVSYINDGFWVGRSWKWIDLGERRSRFGANKNPQYGPDWELANQSWKVNGVCLFE